MDGFSWFRYSVKAGLIGGVISLLMEMLLVPAFLDGSPWAPPRIIAALILDTTQVVPVSGEFEPGVFITGLFVHLALSILFAIPFSVIVFRLSLPVRVLVGSLYGLILFFVNFYISTHMFPWFEAGRNWVTAFSHLVFGIVLALTFNKNNSTTEKSL